MKRGYEMRKWQIGLFFLIGCFFLVGCSNEDTEDLDSVEQEDEPIELFVSAAASLTDAMDELKEIYEADNNVQLTFNFAGSGKLAQQVQQGAPVDVFISANEHWMDTLMEEGLMMDETRVDVTGNKLVLIAQKDSGIDYTSFDQLNKEELTNIAVGNPESVPAGEYTEAVLQSLDKWEDMQDNIVFAKDVRQVLTYVETGNADIGFVYESDALSSDEIKILAESDPTLHEEIIYPGAVTTDSEHSNEGEKFLQFMLSDQTQEILSTYGFTK